MKIIYKFVDGSISEVEVEEELGQTIIASRREEKTTKEKQDIIVLYQLIDWNMKEWNLQIQIPLCLYTKKR